MPLCAIPLVPKHAAMRNAHAILSRAIESAQSFFQAFEKVRQARGAKGTPTDHEQDLLRAALMFATAGLDAMAKQLVRDTLGVVITKDKGAQGQFAEYVQGRMSKANVLDVKYLAHALVAENPREYLKAQLVRELTDNSLQSKEQLLRVAAYFAVGADELTTDLKRLQLIFEARNQIAHEMDVLFGQKNRTRRSRTFDAMHDDTAFILRVASAFYACVEKKVPVGPVVAQQENRSNLASQGKEEGSEPRAVQVRRARK